MQKCVNTRRKGTVTHSGLCLITPFSKCVPLMGTISLSRGPTRQFCISQQLNNINHEVPFFFYKLGVVPLSVQYFCCDKRKPYIHIWSMSLFFALNFHDFVVILNTLNAVRWFWGDRGSHITPSVEKNESLHFDTTRHRSWWKHENELIQIQTCKCRKKWCSFFLVACRVQS